MPKALTLLRRGAEAFLGALVALMFCTFILQITIRYTAKLEWIAEAAPFLNPAHYGWTLEFCLVLWVWIIFAGCSFVVRDRDHVTFDILRDAVGPNLRRWFLVAGCVAVAAALAVSMEPTWSKFHILRLKKTATLSDFLGDWIRMRDIYSVYMVFLMAVTLRCAWTAWQALRGKAAEEEQDG